MFGWDTAQPLSGCRSRQAGGRGHCSPGARPRAEVGALPGGLHPRRRGGPGGAQPYAVPRPKQVTGTRCSAPSSSPFYGGQTTVFHVRLHVLLRVCLAGQRAHVQWRPRRAPGGSYGPLAGQATFRLAPTRFRGLSTGPLLFAPGPNTECGAGLEYVPPESFSLGSSVRQAAPRRAGRPSSRFRGCFLKQNTGQLNTQWGPPYGHWKYDRGSSARLWPHLIGPRGTTTRCR